MHGSSWMWSWSAFKVQIQHLSPTWKNPVFSPILPFQESVHFEGVFCALFLQFRQSYFRRWNKTPSSKLQSWKKYSIFVWVLPKCAIWLNAFFWRSISQKVSEQNCWSQVSVQPPVNSPGFISVTASLGLVINMFSVCYKVLESLTGVLCPRNLISQDHKLSAAWQLSGKKNNNVKDFFFSLTNQ